MNLCCEAPAHLLIGKPILICAGGVLRQPPPGANREAANAIQRDKSAFHLLLTDPSGEALACGRLHRTALGEAQVRYMAVVENARGSGYGSRILEALEAEARATGARKIVLNARDNAVEFYRKRGYDIIGDAETLFGRDSACADGEVIIIKYVGYEVCWPNYAQIGNGFAGVFG
jgi:N-acetylglutamate synthase-like GNAT family acetyltransferase